jgi:hypothetical protein
MDYPRFKLQMKYKMEQDRDGYGSPTGYVYNRLKGEASAIAASWIRRLPNGTEEELWEFLDQQYEDLLVDEKARNKLQNFRQKKQSLPAFNAEFMRLAFDAGESDNHPSLKSRYLSAIRPELQDRMITVEVPREWGIHELMGRVALIEENLYRSRIAAPQPTHRASTKDKDAMEWEYTRTNTGRVRKSESPPKGKKRARWVSQAVRDERRQNRQCLRCGRGDHFIMKCDYLPPERPAQARSARDAKRDNAEEGREEESESEDSGN